MPGSREQEIQRLRRACGCTTGMAVMLLCLGAYVVYDQSTPTHAGSAQRLLVGAAVALAGAVTGKLAGLLWAHARLVRLLRRPEGSGG